MLFSSASFIFLFLPVTWAVFAFLRRIGVKDVWVIAWLLAASLFFYGYWRWANLGVLGFSILFNYWTAGRILGSSVDGGRRWLVLGITVNLALLGYFKYAGFFTAGANAVMGGAWVVAPIALPLGISFFTFQKIAFLADTYRERLPRPELVKFSLFVSFFPQLISGPITHFKELIPQLERPGFFPDRAAATAGISLFCTGLFKKLVLADPAGRIADQMFFESSAGGTIGFFGAAIGIIAYSIQIYLDFSGYSEMALGLGEFFGIRLPQNFSRPYHASNIIDFWRRWHITLSRFLRDYLYIPLGGNRNGVLRQRLNLLVVMLIGGLWHGAGLHYVVWGGLHGLFLTINHIWRDHKFPSLPSWAGHIVTLTAVGIAWVFFRATDMDQAGRYLAQLAIGTVMPSIGTTDWLVLGIGVSWIAFENRLTRVRENWTGAVWTALLFLSALLCLNQERVFLYFNF